MTHPAPTHDDLTTLKDAFDTVCAAPRDQRAAAIEEIARERPDLAARVEQLIDRERTHRGLASLFSFDDVPGFAPLREGDRVGSAQIVSLLARRSSSELYEARHAISDQRLALKLLFDNASLLDPNAPQEARILAALDHPGIVPILEAGVLTRDDGVAHPYIVMPFIEGETLDGWADRARPGHNGAARLVADVADAVQHAHVRGVVHRDLKPSNILIDGDGRARVLDFGVSVLLSARAPSLRAGTPGYMAPEQADPEAPPPDTRADVFALGVILAGLLGGVRIDPERPDAYQRFRDSLEPALRSARIPAQLRAVVRCAAALDPDGRYASAGELAADLRRAAADLPIAAAPPSLPRRIALACGRRPGLALLTALFALAVVAAIAGTATQAVRATRAQQRAETRYEHARDFANWVINDLDRRLRRMPNSTEARRAIIERATETLDALQSTAAGDSDILLDVAEAKLTLSRLHTDYYGPNLGAFDSGLPLLEEIEPIVRRLAATGDERAMLLHVKILDRVYSNHSKHPLDRVGSLTEAIEIAGRLNPEDPVILALRANMQTLLARGAVDRGALGELQGLNEQARALAGRVRIESLSDSESLTDLALAHLYIGVSDMDLDPLDGEDHLLLSTACFDRMEALGLADSSADSCRPLFYLAKSRANHGDLDGALALIETAIDRSRRSYELDPADYNARRILETCLGQACTLVVEADLGPLPPDRRRALAGLAADRMEEAIAMHRQRDAIGQINYIDRRYIEMYEATLARARAIADQP